MRVERLTIKGVLAVTGTLDLDLRDLPSGLVALVGEIGAGKTTLLETPIAVLHREFPSREKDLTAYALDKDSFMSMEFSVDGGAYRARVSIDANARTSNAVLEMLDPSGLSAVLNDGKVSTYKAVIEREFPSRELMLASTFAAQNKAGSFITLKPAKRKELFMQLLGIGRYEQLSVAAKANAQAAETVRGRLKAVRDRLAVDTSQAIVDAIDTRAHQLQTAGGDAEVREAELQQRIDILDARLSMVADEAVAFQAATQRVRDLAAVKAEREAELRRLALNVSGNDLAHDQDLTDIGADYAKQRKDLAERLLNNQDVKAKSADILAAVDELAAVDAEVQQLLTTQEAQQRDRDRLEIERRAVEGQLVALDRVQRDFDQATRDAEMATCVPCAGEGIYAVCRFLGSAHTARLRLPDLAAQLHARPPLVAQLDELRRQLESNDADRQRIRQAVSGAQARRAAILPRTKNADKVAQAQGRIEEIERQIAALEPAEQMAITAAHGRHTERSSELATLTTAAQLACSKAVSDLAMAEADLKASAEGNAQAAKITADLAAARAERDVVIATIARVKAEAAHLQTQRETIEQKRAEMAILDRKVVLVDTHWLNWQTLQKALSRDGLPVLEIDAAGPTVSSYTNELLSVCFGPRFTVELVTQDAKADGKGMKEDFAVKVFDNKRGGDARDLTDLSGGEQVIVSEALMNAIALYVNTRSPQPIRTCWRDETTGSLDPETAPKYLAMLRKVQELGGFHHVFFITHNPAAAALADAQIRVDNGRAEILLPPFVEAA
jgi:DNA repair protein SbcC/Rad50